MMNILKQQGSIKVIASTPHLLSTRNIKPGDIMPHYGTGRSCESHKKLYYLVVPENGKPVVLYEDEVLVLN